MLKIQFEDVVHASQRIASFCHTTPVLISSSINTLVGAQLFFKAENLQKTGSFKCRGASNAVGLLAKDGTQAVITHSAGNHGAALAYAARRKGIACHVVVPKTAPQVKVKAIVREGAQIIFCEPTLEARQNTAQVVISETNAVLVHPYEHPAVIAGQGTATLELLTRVPDLDALVVPVGGGGLCSGTAITARHLRPNIHIFGAEPALADDARRSLQAGIRIPSTYPDTVADGLRTSLGELPFSILRREIEDIFTATEEEILTAMALIYSRLKTVVEPSGAVALAAILANQSRFTGLRIGVFLSGGNVDLSRLGTFFQNCSILQ